MLATILEAIYHFVGGKLSYAHLEKALDVQAAANPEKLDWRNSIVDLLKLTGQDSSLPAREALARELGYPGPYDGSAAMNIWLHEQVINQLR
jgi:hypothetical protein